MGNFLNGLDLFSGIGGLSLALSPWVRPIAYCENDKYAQAVLLSRMRSGDIAPAPVWDDVRTLTSQHVGDVDIIYGGFPCQDISCAGNGEGLGGERSKLFFEITRLVSGLRPNFVFLENVPAITLRGLDRICLGFTSLGYDCRWTVVSAAEVGALHLRERWFFLAHANGDRIRELPRGGVGTVGTEESPEFIDDSKMANPESERCREEGRLRYPESEERIARSRETLADAQGVRSGPGRFGGGTSEKQPEPVRDRKDWESESYWAIEPDVGRVVDGLPARVDRIRGLGNAVVPLQARTAFERLAGLDRVG